MGLALSEKLVRQHGGRIDFRTGPAGTTFSHRHPPGAGRRDRRCSHEQRDLPHPGRRRRAEHPLRAQARPGGGVVRGLDGRGRGRGLGPLPAPAPSTGHHRPEDAGPALRPRPGPGHQARLAGDADPRDHRPRHGRDGRRGDAARGPRLPRQAGRPGDAAGSRSATPSSTTACARRTAGSATGWPPRASSRR